MHRFHRMHLSPEAAMARLDAIDLEEKSRIAEGISLIAVIDHRRDFLAAGYASMFSYCNGRLHMSEDKAVRRIEVARAALKVPEVLEYLADGRLSVTTACVLAPHLTPEMASGLLAAAAFRSRQELVQLLAERARLATEGALALDGPTHVEDSSNLSAPVRMNSHADAGSPAELGVKPVPLPPANAAMARRGRLSATENGGYEVRLSITVEEHDDLRRAQALLGHAVPSGDPALVYARAMKHYVAHLEKQRLGASRKASRSGTVAQESRDDVTPSASPAPGQVNEPRCRGIPKALRRQVWERDGGRCAFVGTDGHRCESTRRLEFDHIVPLANGGKTTPENLRLLCRAHNQYEAERVLGKEHVAHKRELSQRERARNRVAVKAGAARANARNATMQARHDDIDSALRGLGFKVAEAKRGAELADAMPEASLEACVRHALTVLTHPSAIRGERRARCSA